MSLLFSSAEAGQDAKQKARRKGKCRVQHLQ